MDNSLNVANLLSQRREIGHIAGTILCTRYLLVRSTTDNPYLMTVLHQLSHGFLANAAGAAGHENPHAHASS